MINESLSEDKYKRIINLSYLTSERLDEPYYSIHKDMVNIFQGLKTYPTSSLTYYGKSKKDICICSHLKYELIWIDEKIWELLKKKHNIINFLIIDEILNYYLNIYLNIRGSVMALAFEKTDTLEL